MSVVDTAALRATAEAATPGPWHDVHMGSEGSIVLNDGMSIRTARKPATCREPADAAHIAAFDPPTVLALLAELATLRATVADAAESHCGCLGLLAGPITP